MLLFEEHTHPLTEYELSLVDGFVKGFNKRIGAENAITNKQIIEGHKRKNIHLTESRVRKIINYIRCNNIVMGLMASSKGYYVSRDRQEIEQYTESLRGRVVAITSVMERMNEYQKSLK